MEIILHSIPPPCERGRICKNGGFYSPTRRQEEFIALEIMANMSHQNLPPIFPLNGPCSVSITYNFGPNKHTIITVEPLNLPHFAPRGDIDNRDKTVLDSLEKANVFTNDSLVYQLNSKYQLLPKE